VVSFSSFKHVKNKVSTANFTEEFLTLNLMTYLGLGKFSNIEFANVIDFVQATLLIFFCLSLAILYACAVLVYK
jgi:hypothetical protein